MSLSLGQRILRSKVMVASLIALLVVIVITGIHLWLYHSTHVSTDDAFVQGHVSPVSALVTGPVSRILVEDNENVEKDQILVELDPKYYLAKLQQAQAAVAIAESQVEASKQQVIFSRETSSGQVAQAQAEVQAASSAVKASEQILEQTKAMVASKKAALAVAEAELQEALALEESAKLDFERMQHLLGKKTISQQEYDRVKANSEAATAKVVAARGKTIQFQRELEAALAELKAKESGYVYSSTHLGVESAKAMEQEAEAKLDESLAKQRSVIIREAELRLAEARLKEALANLEFARHEYEDTVIQAPVSGRITKKTVELGQVVHPGQPLLAIVPLNDIWIVANFKETQLTDVRPGQKVKITVDTYPGQVFTGTVDSIQAGTGARFSILPPENATGNFVKVVQRIPVKILLDKQSNPHVLRPGMSVVPTITLH